MDWQIIINSGLGIVVAAIGWFAREIWDAIKELRKDIKQIETALPEHYVRKDDFKDAIKDIKDDMKDGFNKIEHMIGLVSKKLESKQDK
jgi:hypothetical protein